tara:strand:+ start:306 stop:608 length:303 start_codon:yes stop_codon:yes gene_type:complete
MIKVYQVNSQNHKAMYPETPFTYGLGKFDPIKNIDKYEHVADLDVADLNEAFQVGNIGPESKYTRYKPMHSVSVGDILVEDNKVSIVANCGFDVLDVTMC